MLSRLVSVLWGLGAAVWLAYTVRRISRHLLFFQIEEYDNARFAALLGRNLGAAIDFVQLILALGLTTISLSAHGMLSPSGGSQPSVLLVSGLLWAMLYTALFLWRKPRPTKKALVMTPRATRLLITACLLSAGMLAAFVSLVSGGLRLPGLAWGLLLTAAAAMVINQGAGLLLIIANIVNYPLEALIRWRFVLSAHRTFRRRPDIQTVAVTGSYGKTSTKEIIAHILSSRFTVLKTPRSFNTLMGICRVIREELRPEHQVFVVEMGTYKKGEIARLCRLTPPHLGVLTAVGPQHLERFKTLERIAAAKYELMEYLPADSVGIFNGDDHICRDLASRPAPFNVCLYGLCADRGPLDVRAANVIFTDKGMEFDVSTAGGTSARFTTSLLGRHNVSNILAGVSVALQFGLSLDEIARSVATLRPVEHRLQLIDGASGVTVIDDAYNANPAGVRMALEVLADLPGRNKVLVTPGMVELGEREEEEHRRMGELAAGVCDYVILVGATRTRAIAEGLATAGFSPGRLVVVEDMDAATQELRKFIQAGDVVLFENDLPDTYTLDVVHF